MPRIESSNLISPGTKGQQLSDMTMTAVMRRMIANAVPYGFRSNSVIGQEKKPISLGNWRNML